ncbi:MAG: hypothetical protein FJ271_15565 [Planctomycetes bacterium]|nr:hypothetical protein [Planctomycetota bacterium]
MSSLSTCPRDPRGVVSARKLKAAEPVRDRGGPRAMLITCTDSLLDEHLLPRLRDEPLMVWRTSGHVVPPYGAGHGDAEEAIDDAVRRSGVREIIMCGHLSCHALQTLMHHESHQSHQSHESHESHKAHGDCLQFARPAQRIAEDKYGRLPREQLLQAMIEENVFLQMTHLRTYPVVRDGLARGTLMLHSWIYDHDTDEIYGYEPGESALLRRMRGKGRPSRQLLPYIDPCEIYLA